MSAVSRGLCLLLCAAALAACDTVEFQSPPGELAACDEALIGDWRLEDVREEPEADGRQYLRVTGGCERWYTVSTERDETGAEKIEIDDLEEDMRLGFARTSSQAFVVTHDVAKEGDAAPQDKPKGYTLIAWDAGDDGTITLRQVDLRKVSHLIIDGEVPGWIEKRDRRADGSRDGFVTGHWVFVFGSGDEVRAFLEKHAVLDAPWMRLLPASSEERARIDAWLASSSAVEASKGFEPDRK